MPPPTRYCGFADPVQAAKGQKQEEEEKLGGYHRGKVIATLRLCIREAVQ